MTALTAPERPAALRFAAVSVDVRDGQTGAPRTLLRDLDWSVEPGEHWAVLGPNGAGKTTLVNTATGGLSPSSGTVTVFGERLGAIGLRDPRLRVGLMESTTPTFARRLRAIDVAVLRSSGPIALRGQRIPPEDVERATELLELFGCAGVHDRRFGDCSQGERQRIMLARALMRGPDILVLDEPTTGLDLPGREGLLQAMARLAADRPRLATVSITHHVEELPSSTTHILLLRDGRVVSAGPVADTLTEHDLSACFGVPVSLGRLGDRWVARAREPGW
jgi:iron complex transport system ATP-binding protein